MKNLFLLNRSGMSPEVTCRKGRYCLDPILSRFSLVSLICVLMLTLGVGSVWSATTTYQSSFSSTSADNLGSDANISYSCIQAASASAPAINSSKIRLYQTSTTYCGGVIRIYAGSGCTITSVVIRSTDATTIGWISSEITASVLKTTYPNSASLAANTEYTISSLNTDVISIANFGSTSSNRLDINYLEVTYNSCTPPATALSITNANSVLLGSTLSLTTNSPTGGNGNSITWSVTAGTGSASVVGSTLTPATAGTVTVKAVQTANGDVCGATLTQTVTINKRTATITLSEAGSESTVSGTHHELDEYTLPSSSGETCGDKVLVGWSKVEVEETDTKPSSKYYQKGTTVTLSPGSNYFYAVYATATPGEGDWEKYTASTIAEGDYILVGYGDGVMKNTINYNRVEKQNVSVNSDGTITYNSEWASACTWHIAKSGDYYTIKNGDNYVVSTGTKNEANLSSTLDDKAKYSVTYHATDGIYSNTFEFTNKYNSDNSINATFRRSGSAMSTYFACYSNSDAHYINLYRRMGYTEYSTDCCEKPATALSITSANTVAMGNTITLSSTGGNGGSVTWTVTAGSGSGTIAAGVFTPSSAGTVTIKAHQDQNTVLGTKYCAQDVEQEVTITVNTTGVEVDPISKAIVVGETFTITPTVSPSDATDKTVSWSSNAEGKATVSSAGLVTGVAAGSATITCTTTNGSYTANCAVTVYGVTMQAKALVNEELVDIPGGTPGAPTRSGKNISPADNANNYVFDHWEIANATLGSSATTKNNTITNPTGAVTVTAVYLPGVEIKWYVNGEEWRAGDPDTSVESGTQYKDLKFPTDPTKSDGCGDKFVGWTDHSMGAATGQSAPTPLLNSGNSDTTPITTAKEFHAVFADYAN